MSTGIHPILSCADARAWESRLLRDESAEWAAMQQAGAAIAREIIEDYREIGGFPETGRILVLAGKGHNGGDAMLAAGELLRRFSQARAEVIFAFGEADLRPLAGKAWSALRGTALLGALERSGEGGQSRVQTSASRSMALESHATKSRATLENSYDLCLDGIFGMQFRLPLDEQVAELIARVNTHPRIRFRAAVDLPSGLGEKNAGTVFRADFTYATGILKFPVVQPENAPFVGRVRYLDLGFFEPSCSPLAGESDTPSPASGLLQVLTTDILAPLAALRRSQTDKRTFGHLFLVGGSMSFPGAIVLSARAALRSGVGLVTAFVPEALVADYSARYPEVMWVGMPVNAAGAMTVAGMTKFRERISRATALAIGPGLSADADALSLAIQLVQEADVPLVLDADALRPEVVRPAIGKPFILTPHAGERKRLEPVFDRDDMLWPPFGVIVEKGPLTRVIGHTPHQGSGRPRPLRDTMPAFFHSPFGGPVLARGGSGDVLAGLIGGLLAQAPADPLLAACRGVVWHGRSADLLARARGQVAVELSEILEHLGPALTASPCPTPPP